MARNVRDLSLAGLLGRYYDGSVAVILEIGTAMTLSEYKKVASWCDIPTIQGAEDRVPTAMVYHRDNYFAVCTRSGFTDRRSPLRR